MTELAIVGGDVWDGTASAVRPGATILIAGDRIERIGVGLEIPDGVETVDARGKFVMPGLIDMHVHVQLCGDDSLLGFLGAGVTAVRDLGSDITTSLPMRDALAAGERVGPRMFVYGPLLDGDPPIFPPGMALLRSSSDAEQGRAAIEELIATGVDGIKLYAGLRPDLLEAMVRAVDGRVPVTVHLGRTWASEAVRAGIDCLEHVHATAYQDVARTEDRHGREDGNGANPQYWRWLCLGWANADLDAPYVGEFIDLLFERRVALSPTTVLLTGGWATSEALSEPGQRYRPRFMTERIAQTRQMREAALAAGQLPPDLEISEAVGQAAKANQLEFLRRLHTAGGIVVPSTDVGAAPMQVPGFSLHRELALLVEGGIANADVLAGATRVAAEVLRRDADLGTLEAGKLADLLVIDGDPLAHIEDTRRLEVVVRGGRTHEPQALLDRIEVPAS